jgi:hypothetical protein
MAEPKNGDIVETTFNYTPDRRARSFLGQSLIEVFEGAEDTGPGVYHPGDVVNYATQSGETSATEVIGRMWYAAGLAQAIDPGNRQLPLQLFQLGSTPDEMYSAYLS